MRQHEYFYSFLVLGEKKTIGNGVMRSQKKGIDLILQIVSDTKKEFPNAVILSVSRID